MTKEEFKRRLIELCVEARASLLSPPSNVSWFSVEDEGVDVEDWWELEVDYFLEVEIDQALENREVTTAKETDENQEGS